MPSGMTHASSDTFLRAGRESVRPFSRLRDDFQFIREIHDAIAACEAYLSL
jgi:hypothetical protein